MRTLKQLTQALRDIDGELTGHVHSMNDPFERQWQFEYVREAEEHVRTALDSLRQITES